MRNKKTEKADLESKKSIFFLIGLIIVLSVVWWAFEYKVTDVAEIEFEEIAQLDDEEDLMIQTQRDEPPPPPPEQPQSQVIEIVDDNIEVDVDLDINVEADDETIIDEAPIYEEGPQDVEQEEIFVYLEDQPEFKGGDAAIMKYIRENVVYPEIARASGVQGTVHLTFVVEKDGSISNVKVLRGIGAGCDEEAIRVVKSMPAWKPGKQRGRPVRARFNLPIKFTLN
jgi:protein TonB